MDFVLRDAYMSGYNTRAYDLERLLRYSFFSEAGLTIHVRGVDALLRFIGVRAELFRTIYFHRTVRAIDLELKDLFTASRPWLFPGNPLEKLDEYLQFTEWTLLVDAARWRQSSDPEQAEVGQRWQDFFESPSALENDLPAHAGLPARRCRSGQHFQQREIRGASVAIGATGKRPRYSVAGRSGATCSSAGNARAGGGAEFSVRSGAGQTAAAG